LPSRSRLEAYEAVGRYIASHSQVMLALWDGHPSNKPGGTSVFVEWRRAHTYHRGQPPLRPDPIASGPILHVRTPRLSVTNIDRPLEVDWLYPVCAMSVVDLLEPEDEGKTTSREFYDGLMKRQDDYNAYIASSQSRQREIHKQSVNAIPLDAGPVGISRASRRLLHAHAAADTLALANQRHTLHTLNLLCGLVLIAVVLYELVSHILHPHASPYSGLLGGFSLLLLAAVCLLLRARRRLFQAHYQDCRALAEGLRVQFFWSVAGIPESVASHYLNHARELGWIRSALHGSACLAHATAALQPDFSFIRDHWLENQYAYFARKLPEEIRQRHRWEVCKNLFLGASIVLALLGALVVSGGIRDWFQPHSVVPSPADAGASISVRHHAPAWESWLLAGVGMTLVLSAMAHFYGEKRAFAAHEHQYRPIRDLHAEAMRRFDLIQSDPSLSESERQSRLQDLLRELGSNALAENAEWLSAHRERPLEVPVP